MLCTVTVPYFGRFLFSDSAYYRPNKVIKTFQENSNRLQFKLQTNVYCTFCSQIYELYQIYVQYSKKRDNYVLSY